MGGTPCLLTQLRRKHLLHVSLAAEIRDLGLRCQIRVRSRSTHGDLILHLAGRLQDDVRTLIRNQRRFEILLTQRVIHVHHDAVLGRRSA